METPLSDRFSSSGRVVIICSALIVLFYGFKLYPSLCNLVFVALIIAVVFNPVVNNLKGRGWSHGAAVLASIAILVFLMLLLVVFFIISAELFIKNLSTYQTQLDAAVANLQNWLTQHGVSSSTASSTSSSAKSAASAVLSTLSGLFSDLEPILFVAVFSPLIATFILLEGDAFRSRIRRRFDSNLLVMDNLNRFSNNSRRYIIVTALLGLLKGTLVGIVLYIMGIDLAFVWGGLYAILNFVPYIGIFIAFIPPITLAWIEYGPQAALVVFLTYEIVDNVVNYVVQPVVMGEQVDISMTFGLLFFFFFTWVFGPIGAILSYLYTLLLKDVFLSSFEDTRWLAEMMNLGLPKTTKGKAGAEENKATA